MTLYGTLLDGAAVDIDIHGTTIRSVTPHTQAARPDDSIDARGLAVFPGLHNMHSHAPMVLLRGVGDDQPLDQWLNDWIWPRERRLTDTLIYQGTLQACREMLASGTTAFNDMYFRIPAMAKAVAESGMKCRLGFTVFGDAAELEQPDVIDMLGGSRCESRIQYAIAPHAIYTVSEKGLRRCAQMCRQLHLPMHIHMSETLKEVEDCLSVHGCRPWQWLDRIGILDMLGSDIIAAHCLHLSDDEIALIGQHGITCVHCPNSNLKLGSGYRFPMLELIDAGANVVLGTDGSASSNNLDMIEVMKTAALLQKGWRNDPTAVPAGAILQMGTCGNTIAPGKPADLFLVKTNSVPSTALSNHQSAESILSDLVYATHGEAVMLTMVDGSIRHTNKQ